MTGNRVSVPTTRLSEWAFVQRPPPNGMVCSRRSCRLAGVLRLDRGTTPEWVCPRHMPLGTQATLDMTSVPSEARSLQPIDLTPCPSCSSPLTRQGGQGEFNLWDCRRCNYAWTSVSPPLPSLEGTDEGFPTSGFDWFDHLERLLVFTRNVGLPTHRIDLDPTVWAYLYSNREAEVVHGSGRRAYHTIPILVLGSECTVPITIQTRDLGLTTSMPVSRLGGQPGRTRLPGTGNSTFHDFERETRNRGLPVQDIVSRSGILVSSNSRIVPESSSTETGASEVPTAGSLWINRSTGDLVEVVSHSTGAFNVEAVVFRLVSGGDNIPEPQNTMLWNDFLSHHQLRSPSPLGPEPTVIPAPGEEWEHVDKTEIVIFSVDLKLQIVSFVDQSTKYRRSLPLHEFSTNNWRRIVRRTAFEHIMDDEF